MATIEDGLTIDVMDHQGVILLELSGELTALDAQVLLDAVDAALARKPKNLQLGLRGVFHMDSGGLQVLVLARGLALAALVPVQLLGRSMQVNRILEITGLKGVFDNVE